MPDSPETSSPRLPLLTRVALGCGALIVALSLTRLVSCPVWFFPIRHRLLLYTVGMLGLLALIKLGTFIVNLFKIRIHLLELLLLCAAASIPLGVTLREAVAAPDADFAGLWIACAAANLFSLVAGALWGVQLANRLNELRTGRRLLFMGAGACFFGGLLALPANLFVAEELGTPLSETVKIAVVSVCYAALAASILLERYCRRQIRQAKP